jgi:hypothetical protein
MKLSYYNIDQNVISLLKNYLSNRKLAVKVDSVLSKETYESNRGVPQGSILGPLLFIIYLNDLPKLSTNSRFVLFADDTTLYLSSSNLEKVLKDIELDLRLISEWLSHNRLVLNLTKTNAMHFPLSRSEAHIHKELRLTLWSGKG